MTAAPLTHLRYDAHEPLPAFRERQRHAYQAGKAVWRDGRISAQVLLLYEELVRFVGANRFAWVKEETLALELRRSVSTIKRWMQQLVRVGLILRERRFGATSLTYIAAYDRDGEPEVSSEQDSAADARQAANPSSVVLADTRVDDVQGVPSDVAHEENSAGSGAGQRAAGLFFGRTDEPSIGSSLRRDSFKRQHVKISGGGTTAHDIRSDDEDATLSMDRLEAEGVSDRNVLHELRQQPVEQVEQVIRYVARCRTHDDSRRPGLIVHLLRGGFRAHHNRHGRHRHMPSVQHTAVGARADVTPAGSDRQVIPEWEDARTLLATQLDPQEYITWIAPCEVLLRNGDHVVLGTPNVFVRDEIEGRYRPQLEAALQTVYGQPVTIDVVIGIE
jgi:hypothetical protein